MLASLPQFPVNGAGRAVCRGTEIIFRRLIHPRAGKTVIASRGIPLYLCSMDPIIREFMSKNGAKGGHAGKGTELRKKLNQAAARARWAKVAAASTTAVAPKPKARPKAKSAKSNN